MQVVVTREDLPSPLVWVTASSGLEYWFLLNVLRTLLLFSCWFIVEPSIVWLNSSIVNWIRRILFWTSTALVEFSKLRYSRNPLQWPSLRGKVVEVRRIILGKRMKERTNVISNNISKPETTWALWFIAICLLSVRCPRTMERLSLPVGWCP